MSDALARLSRDFPPTTTSKSCPRCGRHDREARVVVQVKNAHKDQRTWATRTITLCGECAAAMFRKIVVHYDEGQEATP